MIRFCFDHFVQQFINNVNKFARLQVVCTPIGRATSSTIEAFARNKIVAIKSESQLIWAHTLFQWSFFLSTINQTNNLFYASTIKS